MAKFYATPKDCGDTPSFALAAGGSFQTYDTACKIFIHKVQKFCRDHGQGKLAGELWKHPVADGYAQYVVYTCKPLTLVHLNIGDAWHVDKLTARGLRLSDIKEQIEYDKRLAKLFASKKG